MSRPVTCAGGRTEPKRPISIAGAAIFLFLAAFTILVSLTLEHESQRGANAAPDFDAFRIAGLMAREGRLAEAYDAETFMSEFTRDLDGPQRFLWMYPPHYAFVAAAVSLPPRAIGFALFGLASLAAYVACVRRLAPEGWEFTLIVFLPPALANLLIGQHGLMIGALAGLFVLTARARRDSMGAAFALLSLKPHIALGPGLIFLTLLTRRRVAACLAAGGGLAALTTIVFGPSVWLAFLTADGGASVLTAEETYNLKKFISFFGVFASMEIPPAIALAVHAAAALATIAALAAYKKSGAPEHHLWGVGLIALAPVTPYAYEYDLMTAGAGFALIASDIVARSRAAERIVFYAVLWPVTLNPLIQPGRLLGDRFADITVNALLVTGLAVYSAVILRRPAQETPSTG